MTRYLLDTSVFLWNAGTPERLNRGVRDLLGKSADPIFVSAATSWEIAIKAGLGKLKLPESQREYMLKRLAAGGFLPLPITNEHAVTAGELPRHHADPFDRMLVAQAQTEKLLLVTADRQILKYSGKKLLAGI